MNKASRIAAAINSQANPFQLRACRFHCTPVSERRRRTNWDPVRPLISSFDDVFWNLEILKLGCFGELTAKM